MPYARRYVRRRRPRRIRRTRRSGVTPSRAARIANSVLNKRSETKVHTNTLNEVAIDTLSQGTFYDPLTINQGPAVNQRQGLKINLKGIQIKGFLNNNGANLNYVRMCVFFAKDQQDFTSASDVFTGSLGENFNFGTIPGMDAMYYPLNKRLMHVLWDKVYKVGPSGNNGLANGRMISKFIKLNRVIRFDSSTSGADNVHPRLHVGMWAAESPDDTTVGQTVEISALIRCWYKDF